MGVPLLSPESSNTPDATVGQRPDHLIFEWAESADVAGPLALLAATLRIRTATQAVLFRGILDALNPIASILRAWDLNGSPTYGTAKLAAAWNRRPPHLDAMVPRRIGVGTSNDADFEIDVREGLLSNQHDALFFLLGRPYPNGSGEAVHRRMRAWALLHGLRLFALSPKPDKLLYRACRSLGHAALETEGDVWRGLIERIGAHADRWEQVDARLIAFIDGKDKNRLPVHRDFLTAAYQLAKSGSDPYEEKWEAPASQSQAAAWVQIVQSQAQAGELDLEAFEPLAPTLLLSNKPADEIGEETLDICSFETDPEQTTEEQVQAVQIVRFQLGAAARFLPWDWPQLVPPERDSLMARVSRGLESPTHAAERCLLAVTAVALRAGLSMDEVAAVPLDLTLAAAADWWIDLGTGTLARTLPRHAAHWKPTTKTAPLVRIAANELRLPLPMQVVDALRNAKEARPKARTLGQLWFQPGTSLGSAFRSWVKQDPSTARIQSLMLSKLLGQTTYERTQDAVLARLLMSNRVAPLPSSTVYTAYSFDQITPALPDVAAPPGRADQMPLNVAGSLLESVDDDLVNSSFADLLEEMNRHRGRGDVVNFHNAVALYWDATLRAATGVRPVSGLWLSTSQFDWDNSAVYIDDKASPVAHTGRLVPLPTELCANFKAHYVDRHLPWIIGQLDAQYALGSAPLPALLFFVEDVDGPPDLVALENRHRKRKDRNLIEGRLPLNLFRHRLRTLLHREEDVDLEVVDTLLGHSDGGATLTHGSFSMRVWRKDAEAIRPALTRIFHVLHINAPPLWTSGVPVAAGKIPTWKIDRVINRSADQARKTAAQRNQADSIIRQFVADSNAAAVVTASGSTDAGRTDASFESLPALVASLTEDQRDALCRRLLADEQGMPSPTGALRYERLIELAGMAWDQLGLRASFRKHYAVREIEPSPFTPLAARAGVLMAALRGSLDSMFESAGERSRIKLKRALALAVFDLVLTSRITNESLLQVIVAADRQWRVVRFQHEFYLEWSPSDDLERKPTAPIQRFAISLRCAWLLQNCVRGKTRRATAWQSSHGHALPLVAPCAQAFGADQLANSEGLLNAVLSTVDQANVAELPGSVAAFLAGRVLTASLGWGDWLRLRTGKWVDTRHLVHQIAKHNAVPEETQQLQLDQLPDDADDEFETVSETRFRDTEEIKLDNIDPSISRADAAFKLIAGVQKRIDKLRGDEDGSKHRARAAALIGREVHDNAPAVSSAVQLLCLWAIDLLLRPGRSRKLATTSVLRYFGKLSKRFKAIAYDIDLATMEDVEIEEFYASVLSGSTVENLKDTFDGLWNFHKFAQMACGLADIDWSALAVSDRIRLGSPGFVDEPSYLELVDRLGKEHGLPNVASWQLQCVALLAFRFGLRGGEATGLRRSDLRLDGPQPYLIVRNNRERDLKTRASRRVIPLLFDLTPAESSVIAKLRDFHAIDGVGLEDAPAFASVDDPSKAVDGFKMRAAINRHLKAITGQASSSMHKLRKAFAIRVWRAIEAPDYEAVGLPRETDAARQRIRLTLLGPGQDRISRRGAWAVARAMGHGHPQVLRSYVHILSEVAQKSVEVALLPASLGLSPDLVKVPALDSLFVEVSPTDTAGPAVAPAATPVDSLRALLFLSRGRSPSEAAEYSGVSIPRVEQLGVITERIYKRLLDSDPGRLQQHADNPQSRRLARRGILSLLHINAHARLRAGLTTLPATLVQRLSSIASIDAAEWEAMVGTRREISMWEPHHFALTAIVAHHFLKEGSRPKLLAPKSMTNIDTVNRLTDMAVRAGWLPRGDAMPQVDGEAAPLCRGIEAVGGLPRVRRADKGFTVDDRLVLRLTGVDSSDRICDGLELAVALACLNTFSSAAST